MTKDKDYASNAEISRNRSLLQETWARAERAKTGQAEPARPVNYSNDAWQGRQITSQEEYVRDILRGLAPPKPPNGRTP